MAVVKVLARWNTGLSGVLALFYISCWVLLTLQTHYPRWFCQLLRLRYLLHEARGSAFLITNILSKLRENFNCCCSCWFHRGGGVHITRSTFQQLLERVFIVRPSCHRVSYPFRTGDINVSCVFLHRGWVSNSWRHGKLLTYNNWRDLNPSVKLISLLLTIKLLLFCLLSIFTSTALKAVILTNCFSPV